MSTVAVVKGDSKSNLQVTLVREDLGTTYQAGGSTIVRMRLRKVGTTTVLPTSAGVVATLVNNNYIFDLGTFLTHSDVSEGYYEGEIELEFGDTSPSTFQTIFDPVSIQVREAFG